jgi:uncharacterized membrane protein
MLDSLANLDRHAPKAALFVVLGLLLFAIVVVVPALEFDVPQAKQDLGDTQRGTVTRVLEETQHDSPRGTLHYQKLEVRVGDKTVTIERSEADQDANRADYNAGDKVLVTSTSGTDTYYISDYARDNQLWVLSAVFVLLVIAIGRWQGLTSLIGMVASLLVILRFIVPGILAGHDPVTVSVIGAITIMISSLYLSHGVNRKTTVALLATAVSLAITAALASISIDFAKLSGLADEQAATVSIITSGGIDPRGLLLAGMIIGALGVLDDVTVAQASAVYELKDANPLLRPRDLFARAMNIGRDHIASTVNTLFLAYAGAALPLLILFSLQTEPADILINRDFLATELVRTLVGSIGIVASVPLTTILAATATDLNLTKHLGLSE